MIDERWIEAPPDPADEAWANRCVNLADASYGAEATAASDEFFAPRERMLNPARPVFYPDRYDDHGKWMDGWESRRRRGPGHDWCVVRLARRGMVRAVNVETSFFTGNFPPEMSLEALDRPGLGGDAGAEEDWREVVPRGPLLGDAHNVLEIGEPVAATHLRLHIYPDGGIARLRVYGDVDVDWERYSEDDRPDLASVLLGARAVAWSDAHYGSPSRMLAPGRGKNMGDGWETARRRGPGNDWAVIRLGHAGTIEGALVDTAHFKGNYPDRFALRGALLDGEADPEHVGSQSESWETLVPETKLEADCEREFEIAGGDCVDHVRLDIYPDGGISRLRLYGRLAR